MTKKLLDSIIMFRSGKIKIAKEELYVQKKNQFEMLMMIIVN